ncbi:hypothetical protein OCU04_001048 [Sclerotinia nivalis]|uniref:Uncharacterized protein n=1 Tax=Sclerotinia nivalis TaxID=352851 RepID=A0A9X0AXC3_9HELO|nr:hypothetical protein OCU04_001048 [Sclerotinia nivalis]
MLSFLISILSKTFFQLWKKSSQGGLFTTSSRQLLPPKIQLQLTSNKWKANEMCFHSRSNDAYPIPKRDNEFTCMVGNVGFREVPSENINVRLNEASIGYPSNTDCIKIHSSRAY